MSWEEIAGTQNVEETDVTERGGCRLNPEDFYMKDVFKTFLEM